MNTDGSLFYIVPCDSSPTWLDWNEGKVCSQESCHTVYGTVTDGLEFVDAISDVQTQNDKPVNDVKIVSIEITDDGIVDEEPWYQFW